MKAGFVNIIGNPNVGKSTLMNALVGEKLSIITSKAQTTRKRVMGIVNGRTSERHQAGVDGRAPEAEGVANGDDFQIDYTEEEVEMFVTIYEREYDATATGSNARNTKSSATASCRCTRRLEI